MSNKLLTDYLYLMIIKHFEINKINLDKTQFILFYGKNEGLKNQIKNKLLENKSITSNLEEKDIIDNSNSFIESLLTQSFFEEEKIIFINRATDKILKILSAIINKKIEKLIILLDADNLEKNLN